MADLTKPGRRRLIFDADASQFMPADMGGKPCSLCGVHQEIHSNPRTFIRVREKIQGGSREIAHVCPDCVARLFLQVERHKLWDQVTAVVRSAIERIFKKHYGGSKPQPAEQRRSLGTTPQHKSPSRALKKLLPGKE